MIMVQSGLTRQGLDCGCGETQAQPERAVSSDISAPTARHTTVCLPLKGNGQVAGAPKARVGLDKESQSLIRHSSQSGRLGQTRKSTPGAPVQVA